jgi:hypothetical protein
VPSCHDSEFHHITQLPSGNYCNASGSGCHTQVIEDDYPCGGGYVSSNLVYNNLIHDNNAGVNIFVKYNTAKVFNNVMWRNTNNYAIRLCTYSGDSSSDAGFIYNNTIDLTGGNTTAIGWQGSIAGLGSINIQNNHLIGASAAASVQINKQTVSNNLTQTSSVATSQGYTAANKYRAEGSTMNNGINLSSQATGALASILHDTAGAPWFGASYVSRPTGSTVWDAGAYKFDGQLSLKPNPPTSLSAIVQ